MNDINSAGLMLTGNRNAGAAYSKAMFCSNDASITSEPEHQIEDSVNIGSAYPAEAPLESFSISSASGSIKSEKINNFSENSQDKFDFSSSDSFSSFLIAGSSISSSSGASNSLSVSNLGTIAVIDEPQTPEELLSTDMVMNGPSFAKYGIYNTDGDRIA